MSLTLQTGEPGTRVVTGDVSEGLMAAAMEAVAVAVDIETSGLDWASDTIASVQLAVPSGPIEIVRIDSVTVPHKLVDLLESVQCLKVFHHAMFDLRFMRQAWGIRASRIACTKVAAKLQDPSDAIGHRLINLLDHYLGVRIDKSQQVSDWLRPEWSAEQIVYAANDVRYLVPLLYALLSKLRRDDLERLALRCFEHIPTRVELEVRALGDVFAY